MVNFLKVGAIAALALAGSLSLAATPASLEKGTWLLNQVAGQAASGAHLRFAAGKLQGNDACNNFRSSYEAGAAQTLRFAAGSGAATLMACAPEQEQTAKAVKEALTKTQSYQIADSQLQLLDADKNVLAIFALQNEQLEGSKWQVQGLNNGKNAVVSQASVELLGIEFSAKGKLLASSPCGQLASDYRSQAAEHRIHIRKLRANGKTCAKTDAAYAEFKQLKKALERSRTYLITGERIELRDKKGGLQISAKAAP